MDLVNVKYVGIKPMKADNVAHSGAVWLGHGDVQAVTPAVWGKLVNHPDVWALAEEQPAAGQAVTLGDNPPPPEDAAKFVLVHADGSSLVLDSMDDAALKEFVKKHELGNAGNRKGDSLRTFIVEAVKAASGSEA